MSIRLAKPNDAAAILSVAEASGLFERPEVAEIEGLLKEHFAAGETSEHNWLVVDDGGVSAVAYHAPERMTSGTSNLYMLVVHPDKQGRGLGRSLIERVERDLSAAGGRLLLVETLGVEEFEGQRRFYAANGFSEEARIRDFYDAGLDKVVFRKSLI
jgi:GNAT superfamily N-acetyltransferase